MKIIPLTQGFVAWVDDDDFGWLSGHKWFAWTDGSRSYAIRNETIAARPARRRQVAIRMHDAILNPGSGKQVDHIQHRTADLVVDNRRCNLRVASPSQNMMNRRNFSGSSSPFKGVSMVAYGRFSARVTCDGKTKNIGHYRDEWAAAGAYDEAAASLHGDFALTNFSGERSLYDSLPLSPNPDNSPPL